MMMERRSVMENVYHTEDNNYGVPSYSGGMNFEGIDPPLLDPYFVREFEAKLRDDNICPLEMPTIETSVIENLINEYQNTLSNNYVTASQTFVQSVCQNNFSAPKNSLNINPTSMSVPQYSFSSSSQNIQNFNQVLPEPTPGEMSQSETRHLAQLTELNINNLISVLSQASNQANQLDNSITPQLAPSAELTDRDILEKNIDDLFSVNNETSLSTSTQAYPTMINCTATLTPSFAHRPTFVTASKTATIPNTISNQTLSTLATIHPSGALSTATDPPTNRFVMNSRDRHFVPDKRTKISRRNFSVSQIEGLEAVYEKHRFVKRDMRRELAKRLNLSERSISYWFQNKRARSKDTGDGLQVGRS